MGWPFWSRVRYRRSTRLISFVSAATGQRLWSVLVGGITSPTDRAGVAQQTIAAFNGSNGRRLPIDLDEIALTQSGNPTLDLQAKHSGCGAVQGHDRRRWNAFKVTFTHGMLGNKVIDVPACLD